MSIALLPFRGKGTNMTVVNMYEDAGEQIVSKPAADGAYLSKLRTFLSVPGRPVGMGEFAEFWKVCSIEEKTEFREFASHLPE